MPAWNKTDLERIPQKGFEELEMAVPEDIIDMLAKESISSPQLMQLICLNICILAESRSLKEINHSLLKDTFRFSTLNLDYDKVVSVIQKGKSSRGQKRSVYHTEHLGNLDMYGLILEALALDPPFASITFEDLYGRIIKLIQDDNNPTVNSIKNYLKNLQEVLNSCDRSYEVLEWRDNTLYILESLFLFYLRWGRGEKHAA
jgi:hypothetical protein